MNPKVDFYFSKAKKWQEELEKLRMIILDCQLWLGANISSPDTIEVEVPAKKTAGRYTPNISLPQLTRPTERYRLSDRSFGRGSGPLASGLDICMTVL